MKFLILALFVAFVAADSHGPNHPCVKTTWEQVKHSEVDILYNIFKAYPEIQERFPKFRGKDLDSLKDTAVFATHAGRIVGLFSEYIALLGEDSNKPAINHILSDMGHNHKNRGIPKDLFVKFRTAFTNYISAHAEGYDANHWAETLDHMYGIIYSGLEGSH